MERDERNIYIRLGIIIAVWLIAEIILLTRNANAAESAKNAPYSASDSSGEYFIAEESEAAKTGQIREITASGMPCENPEQFERWLETYEQEASEEGESVESGESDPAVAERLQEKVPESECPTEVAAASESRIYSVNGETLSPELQTYLFRRLQDHGCEWMYEVCLCQLYQESRFNARAENRNGLDKGIAQLRITYFPQFAEEAGLVEYDVFNPIDSLYVYAYLTAKNLEASDYDVERTLSRYYTGTDAYSAEYVSAVYQWTNTIREVE